MSDDLHARLKTVIEEMLALARAATPGPWTPYGKVLAATFDRCNCAGGQGWLPHEPHCGDEPISADMREVDAAFIAAHDPPWAIRQHEAALRQLDRHWREEECTMRDCLDVEELAGAYGVPIDVEDVTL